MKLSFVRRCIGFIALFCVPFLWVSPASAGQNDYVKEVYICANDVFIRMQSAGWLIAPNSVMGDKRQDRILSIALTLVSTGKPSGYFDDGPLVSACGLNAKQITSLAIKAEVGG